MLSDTVHVEVPRAMAIPILQQAVAYPGLGLDEMAALAEQLRAVAGAEAPEKTVPSMRASCPWSGALCRHAPRQGTL